MVEIKLVESKEEWETLLKKTENYNIFSSYQWGEYKNKSWEVKRLGFFKSGNFLGMCQFLMKKKFFFLFAWNSGGINLVYSKYLKEIIPALKEYFKKYHFYFRFNFYDTLEPKKHFLFLEELSQVKTPINSVFSTQHDLKKQKEKFSSNHRYYLKKAEKNNLTFVCKGKESIKDFLQIHKEMTQTKNLGVLGLAKEEIYNLQETFGDNFLIATVYQDEKPLSSALVLVFHDLAFYYLAGSNEEGRRVYGAYFMIDKLLDLLREKGIKTFDFAGITPFDKNAKGVNKFKLGFNGDLVEHVGEFELTNSKVASFLFSSYLSLKR